VEDYLKVINDENFSEMDYMMEMDSQNDGGHQHFKNPSMISTISNFKGAT